MVVAEIDNEKAVVRMELNRHDGVSEMRERRGTAVWDSPCGLQCHDCTLYMVQSQRQTLGGLSLTKNTGVSCCYNRASF